MNDFPDSDQSEAESTSEPPDSTFEKAAASDSKDSPNRLLVLGQGAPAVAAWTESRSRLCVDDNQEILRMADSDAWAPRTSAISISTKMSDNAARTAQAA